MFYLEGCCPNCEDSIYITKKKPEIFKFDCDHCEIGLVSNMSPSDSWIECIDELKNRVGVDPKILNVIMEG